MPAHDSFDWFNRREFISYNVSLNQVQAHWVVDDRDMTSGTIQTGVYWTNSGFQGRNDGQMAQKTVLEIQGKTTGTWKDATHGSWSGPRTPQKTRKPYLELWQRCGGATKLIRRQESSPVRSRPPPAGSVSVPRSQGGQNVVPLWSAGCKSQVSSAHTCSVPVGQSQGCHKVGPGWSILGARAKSQALTRALFPSLRFRVATMQESDLILTKPFILGEGTEWGKVRSFSIMLRRQSILLHPVVFGLDDCPDFMMRLGKCGEKTLIQSVDLAEKNSICSQTFAHIL